MKAVWPVKNLCHLSTKVLFWNKWRKKTEWKPAVQVDLEMTVKMEVMRCFYYWYLDVCHWLTYSVAFIVLLAWPSNKFFEEDDINRNRSFGKFLLTALAWEVMQSPTSIHPSVCPSVHPSIRLSVCLSICFHSIFRTDWPFDLDLLHVYGSWP